MITDWNLKADEIIAALPAGPQGSAAFALVQTAVFDAVNAITRQYPKAASVTLAPEPGTSVDAAVAAANRNVLLRMAPSRQPSIEAAYPGADNRFVGRDAPKLPVGAAGAWRWHTEAAGGYKWSTAKLHRLAPRDGHRLTSVDAGTFCRLRSWRTVW